MTSYCLFETELDDENIKIDALLFEEIEEELKEYLLKWQVEGDSADGVFDVLENLTNRLKEGFDEIIGEDSDKIHFMETLTHSFGLLLNTKVGTVNKTKKLLSKRR